MEPKRLVCFLVAHVSVLLFCNVALLNAKGEIEEGCSSLSLGTAVSQTSLIASFAGCVHLPVITRLRWSGGLLMLQWLCFVVPMISVTREWPMPWCIMSVQASVFLAGFIPLWIFRLVSRRTLGRTNEPNTAIAYTYHIADVFGIMTICAVLMSIGFAFNQPIKSGMFAGLVYVIVVLFGLLYGAPNGLVVSIYVVGFAWQSDKRVAIWAIGVPSIVALCFVTVFACLYRSLQPYDRLNYLWFGLFLSSLFVASFFSAMLMRSNGIRWIPKPPRRSIEKHLAPRRV